MARRVVLHVGLMKSGTTFVQGRLGRNRDLLLERGVLFPGPVWARQAAAVAELCGHPKTFPGAWDGLVAEARAHEHTVVLSVEHLAPASPETIARIVEAFEGAEVEAVLTVRDLGRTLPAMWQEAMKNGHTWSWEDYLAMVRRRSDPTPRFWRRQRAGAIAEKWAAGLGTERVHVVVVPPAGRPADQLWARFCEAAGLPDLDWQEGPRSNESLGVASALLMGRVNELVTDLPRLEYERWVKPLAKYVLPEHRDGEAAIGFTPPPWLLLRAESIITRIRESGVHVVGDLDELVPREVPGTDPGTLGTEAQLDAAVDALVRLLRAGAGDPWRSRYLAERP